MDLVCKISGEYVFEPYIVLIPYAYDFIYRYCFTNSTLAVHNSKFIYNIYNFFHLFMQLFLMDSARFPLKANGTDRSFLSGDTSKNSFLIFKGNISNHFLIKISHL